METRPTRWSLYQCERGSQWSSTDNGTHEHRACCFSGCDAEPHKVKLVKQTTDRREAFEWFVRGVK